LELASAPFSKKDIELVPEAGSCVDCPKRTGHNKLLFADMGSGQKDSCSDPKCYAAKLDGHIRQSIAAKPKLVQISTGYGQQKEDSTTLPRNKYVEIRQEKPKTKEEATRPEFKTCKYTTEAIVSEGLEKGETRTVCAQADCPVHHAKKESSAHGSKWTAEEQKRRSEEALAQATGIRTLAAIVAAVPVRLMKRDLLFVVERLAASLDERRLEIVARQRGIKKAKDSDSIAKLFTAYLRRAEEGALSGLLVEITILHAATRQTAAQVLRDAATAYKVDVDAISLRVKHEFAAKEKAKLAPKPAAKATPPKARKAA
jgi:ParB family chromosome partitioning protein